MRLGIFAKTFAGTDPVTVLQAAKAAGFDCVQYNMACSGLAAMPDSLSSADSAVVAQASAATGVAIAAVSGTYNMIHPDPAVRAKGLRRLEILIRNAAAMGTAMVTLCTGSRDAEDQWRHHPDNASPEAWRDLLAEMGKACALAEPFGVTLGIEPELANVVDSADRARLLIDTLQSPALGIVLDPANLFEVTTLPAQRDLLSRAIDLLADRIRMAHAKDRDATGGFATAGKGVVDFPHFLGRLRAAGFTGDLVTHGLRADEAAGRGGLPCPNPGRAMTPSSYLAHDGLRLAVYGGGTAGPPLVFQHGLCGDANQIAEAMAGLGDAGLARAGMPRPWGLADGDAFDCALCRCRRRPDRNPARARWFWEAFRWGRRLPAVWR